MENLVGPSTHQSSIGNQGVSLSDVFPLTRLSLHAITAVNDLASKIAKEIFHTLLVLEGNDSKGWATVIRDDDLFADPLHFAKILQHLGLKLAFGNHFHSTVIIIATTMLEL